MLRRLLLALLIALTAPAAALASATVTLAPDAEPLQFYVFSFTDTPAAEAAQDVVTGALARDLEVDPAVDAIVTFRADGWYSEDALLRDFGTALLDQDIVLIRTGRGAYALVPRANAPMLMARGGTVMRLEEPRADRAASRTPSSDRDGPPASAASWWEGATAALLLFSAGAAAGAVALLGGQIAWRRAAGQRPPSPPVLRLTDQRQSELGQSKAGQRLQSRMDAAEPDPELVIPRFDPGS